MMTIVRGSRFIWGRGRVRIMLRGGEAVRREGKGWGCWRIGMSTREGWNCKWMQRITMIPVKSIRSRFNSKRMNR